jgi:hypothetical protein
MRLLPRMPPSVDCGAESNSGAERGCTSASVAVAVGFSLAPVAAVSAVDARGRPQVLHLSPLWLVWIQTPHVQDMPDRAAVGPASFSSSGYAPQLGRRHHRRQSSVCGYMCGVYALILLVRPLLLHIVSCRHERVRSAKYSMPVHLWLPLTRQGSSHIWA